MKRANPASRVIATNLISEWELGKDLFEHGYTDEVTYPQIGFYTGWLRAKANNVEVGTVTPIENGHVQGRIGTIVYSILPYPSEAFNFGLSAAMIASLQSSTRVAVTSGASFPRDNFKNGFLSNFPVPTLFSMTPGSAYGVAKSWEPGPYVTYEFVVP